MSLDEHLVALLIRSELDLRENPKDICVTLTVVTCSEVKCTKLFLEFGNSRIRPCIATPTIPLFLLSPSLGFCPFTYLPFGNHSLFHFIVIRIRPRENQEWQLLKLIDQAVAQKPRRLCSQREQVLCSGYIPGAMS